MLSFRYTLDYLIARNGGVGGLSTKELSYDRNKRDHVFQGNWILYLSDKSMNEFRVQYSDLGIRPASHPVMSPDEFLGVKD